MNTRADRALVSSLHTIATRTWNPPVGTDREARLTELRERAAGNTDALIRAAGLLLGGRVDNEHDPRHIRATAGAGMLLEVAGVAETDERVQGWVRVGAEQRERARVAFRAGDHWDGRGHRSDA